MKITNPELKKILEKYKEIKLISESANLLVWDQNVTMPKKSAQHRALQLAALEDIVTTKWNEKELKDLVESVDDKVLNEYEKAMIRNIRRATKFYYRVPKKLILEQVETVSKAFTIWQDAKKNNDFNSFAPVLTEVFEIRRQVAGYLGYQKNPYDALLDLYDHDLTAEKCEEVFSYLQPRVTALVKKITGSKEYKKPNVFLDKEWNYARDAQEKLGHLALQLMTYPADEGRLDVSAHPVTFDMGRNDVRITTSYLPHDFRFGFTSTMHEGGHALYELGVNEEYTYTSLAGGISIGIHESQSRFWENVVGRSRELVTYLQPVFHTLFPDVFRDASITDCEKYLNHVAPSFIRVQADEVTYSLHIILRFEIENAMINGKIKATDIPEIWKEKMKKYLGIIPKTDREGCLQDVHWSYGDIGYFPSYTFGNLYCAQIVETMKKDIALSELISRGEFAPIREWLITHMHKYGSLYEPKDLIKKITGKPLDPKYFVDYLEKKYSVIYGLSNK